MRGHVSRGLEEQRHGVQSTQDASAAPVEGSAGVEGEVEVLGYGRCGCRMGWEAEVVG